MTKTAEFGILASFIVLNIEKFGFFWGDKSHIH
jgi:hypothetical protein